MSDSELTLIFNSIDFDDDGKISFPEITADLKHTVESNIEILIKREKERYESAISRSQYNSRIDETTAANQFNPAMPINQAKN